MAHSRILSALSGRQVLSQARTYKRRLYKIWHHDLYDLYIHDAITFITCYLQYYISCHAALSYSSPALYF